MSWLRSLAALGPVPVYPAIGPDMASAVQRLALAPEVALVATPRHARVLLVAGMHPATADQALRRVHAQLPRPCTTLWYRSRPFPELEQPQIIDDWDELPGRLKALHQTLLSGSRDQEPILLPDTPPAPFEGRGDHGQGGEGMMGGTPYGRAMAMTADDLRDGLALDSLEVTLGPLYYGLPPGLVLDLSLQGDLVQHCRVIAPPYPAPPTAPFAEALEQPVPIASLELARARHHLHRLAQALDLSGLGAISARLLRSAMALKPGIRLPWLQPLLRGSALLASVAARCGALSTDQARTAGGPAARAAGLAIDARSDDPTYRQLGFQPIVQHESTTRSRWRQWLLEIDQSLMLSARAAEQDTHTAQIGVVESPSGRLTLHQPIADSSPMLEAILPGCEWSEALALIASLQLAGTSASPAWAPQ